jgi:S1-C subfamily serine protease
MKRMLWFLAIGLGLATGAIWAAPGAPQGEVTPSNGDIIRKAEQSLVLILVGDGSGGVRSVCTGVIIRADGIVLAPYHPLKGAQEVQVRLRDGEVYDQVNLIGFDERRDVAAVQIPASGLTALSGAAAEETQAGDKIHVLSADEKMMWSTNEGVLGQVRLADEVPGAGHGYRVIQFMALISQSTQGGALLNSRGQLLGIITGSPQIGGQQFAVPLEGVAGLPVQGMRTALGTGKNLALPTVSSAPGATAEEHGSPLAVLAKARSLRDL